MSAAKSGMESSKTNATASACTYCIKRRSDERSQKVRRLRFAQVPLCHRPRDDFLGHRMWTALRHLRTHESILRPTLNAY